MTSHSDGPSPISERILIALAIVSAVPLVYAAAWIVPVAIVWNAAFDGSVKTSGPAFAATDSKSFRALEEARTQSVDLEALVRADPQHIVVLAPSTRIHVRADARGFPGRSVMIVKVEDGTEKGSVLWVRASDLAFGSYL